MKKLIIALLILVGILLVFPQKLLQEENRETLKIVKEESVVVDVVKQVGPSVVTVGVENVPNSGSGLRIGPFGLFFQTPGQEVPEEERLIGSGFVVRKDGLIATNKHVVDNRGLKYIVVDSKGTKYNVSNIYRDPLNDIALLRVANPPGAGFKEVKLGDSDKLEAGQFAIAIGTALGEFRNTVTTGVISGLGRGITAGSPFEGFVERLDNVIQTDAAINPGNSGGPLLNSQGEVVGVNTAIASGGENIGFAIPINIVRESIKNFNETGQFNRPFLGVSYVIIGRQAAVLNNLPEGALVREVVDGSAAEEAGIKVDDIITKVDGQKLTEKDGGLAPIINRKKVGDKIIITVFRDDTSTGSRQEKTIELKATLTQASE